MKESTIQTAVRDDLEHSGCFVHVYHGGPFSVVGMPDIHAVYQGQAFYIETKIPGKRLTKAQESIRDSIKRAGGLYFCCTSWQEARACFQLVREVVWTRTSKAAEKLYIEPNDNASTSVDNPAEPLTSVASIARALAVSKPVRVAIDASIAPGKARVVEHSRHIELVAIDVDTLAQLVDSL